MAESLVSENARIRGRVRGEGDFELRGRLEGEIDITGDLAIADGAIVRGNIRATRIHIAGAVLGNVSAGFAIVLDSSARVVGNLSAKSISIALGAQMRGQVDMGIEPREQKKPAPKPAVATRTSPLGAQPTKAAAPVRSTPVFPALPKEVPVTRKAPAVEVPMAISTSLDTADDMDAEDAELEANNVEEDRPGGPPSPVVPSIKKGARANQRSKRGA